MKIVRNFLLNSRDVHRDSLIWNMFGSILVAFQSVIMLMILTRTIDLRESGVFTIAYANANLFLTVGKFGIRNFQVSDVREEYSFSTYKRFRIMTVIGMLVCSAVYVLVYGSIHEYTTEKSLIVIWMCLFKAVDAYEDVYHGYYQQHNRLDVAGKCLTVRMVLTILIFGVGIIVFRDLLIALIVVTVATTVIYLVLNHLCFSLFKPDMKARSEGERLSIIIKACLPLFIGSFLSFYIGNAPKYAIDSVLNDELQACYGFIAMPVFIIGLLNNFIFNPIIRKLSEYWNEGDGARFRFILLRQVGIIAAITLICILGAYLLGIPVLSILYNTDLKPYKAELLILLVGGGFLSLSGLLVTAITIVRKQQYLVIGYVAVALAAALLSNTVVRSYEIRGAALLYVGLMLLLCVFFLVILLRAVRTSRAEVPQSA